MYRLFAVAGVAVVLLFLWEVMNGFSLPGLFFLIASLGFVAVYARWALMRLELTPDGLTVHAPLQMPLHISFRQMVVCSEAGRMAPGLSLVYFPLTGDGFVDTDAPRTLFLPAVDGQPELLAVLEEQMPT